MFKKTHFREKKETVCVNLIESVMLIELAIGWLLIPCLWLVYPYNSYLLLYPCVYICDAIEREILRAQRLINLDIPVLVQLLKSSSVELG